MQELPERQLPDLIGKVQHQLSAALTNLKEFTRRRPRIAVAIGGGIALIIALIGFMALSGGSASGLAGSYNCTTNNGASITINFVSTGSLEAGGRGEYYPLSGTVTVNGATQETFDNGTLENGEINFGRYQDSSGSEEDTADLYDGGKLEDGNLVVGGMSCSPS